MCIAYVQIQQTSFYIRDLSIYDFGVCGVSWKQSPVDAEGQQYREFHLFRLFIIPHNKIKTEGPPLARTLWHPSP